MKWCDLYMNSFNNWILVNFRRVVHRNSPTVQRQTRQIVIIADIRTLYLLVDYVNIGFLLYNLRHAKNGCYMRIDTCKELIGFIEL